MKQTFCVCPLQAGTVRNEMLLLSNAIQREDSCWEQRVRCLMRLFLISMRIKSPVVLEYVALPCLRILQVSSTDLISKSLIFSNFDGPYLG